MLIKMLRSQRTAIGTLRAGVVYNLDDQKHGPTIARLLDRNFAIKTTKSKQAKDAAADADRAERAK